MKERIDYIDTAKGLTILLVLFLHISMCYPNHPYQMSSMRIIVSTFFMPVFFILSGLFFSTKGPAIPWLKKKCKRLLIPYCFFYLLTYVLSFLMVEVIGVDTKNGFHWDDIFVVFHSDVFSNATIWFLLALFWSNCMLFVIDRSFPNWWSKIISVIIVFICGEECSRYGINIPLYVDSAMSMLPFLFLGYLLKNTEIKHLSKKRGGRNGCY